MPHRGARADAVREEEVALALQDLRRVRLHRGHRAEDLARREGEESTDTRGLGTLYTRLYTASSFCTYGFVHAQ